MVIAAQMEHTVRHEEGEFTQFAVSVFLRLFLHLPRVDHDVAEHHASVVRVDAAVVDRAVEIRRHLKLQGGKREDIRIKAQEAPQQLDTFEEIKEEAVEEVG